MRASIVPITSPIFADRESEVGYINFMRIRRVNAENHIIFFILHPVASLRMVTPGAKFHGVTLHNV